MLIPSPTQKDGKSLETKQNNTPTKDWTQYIFFRWV